jgi:putative DNA primase/helicase
VVCASARPAPPARWAARSGACGQASGYLADPFRRTGFSQPNLIGWVHEHRQQLLHDALLVLRAYIVAGRPSVGLDALGSFEEWSALVRNAVVWAGLPDPLDTMRGEVELDPETETLRSLLLGLEALTANGPVTSQRIAEAVSHAPDPVTHTVPNAALTTAIGELVATMRPSATQISNALRPLVGRGLDGRKLAARRTSAGWTWSVLREGDDHDGSDGPRRPGQTR